jgi:hypothetical protein
LQFLLVPSDAEQSGSLDLLIAYRHPFKVRPDPKPQPEPERPPFVDDGTEPEKPVVVQPPKPKHRDDEEAPEKYFPLEARALIRVNQMHKSFLNARSAGTQSVLESTGYSTAAIGVGIAYRAQDPLTVGLDFRWYRTFNDTYDLKLSTTLSNLRQAYGIAQGQWLHALPRWEFESWVHWKPSQNWRVEATPRFAALTSATAREAFDLAFGGDAEVTYRWTRAGYWDESFRGWAVVFGGAFGMILSTPSQIAAAGTGGVTYSF